MQDFNALTDRYIAVWNETDKQRRLDLIAQTWTEDATYIDPLMQGEGHAGIDAMVEGVQAQFPGFVFSRDGSVDAHHDRIRFSWDLGPAGTDVIVKGTDFAIISDDGRLLEVTGFIDMMPG